MAACGSCCLKWWVEFHDRSDPTCSGLRRNAVSSRLATEPGPTLRQMRGFVTVISAPQEYNEENLYVDLRSTLGRPLFLKCEGFNFAGSVKLKAAAEMVEAAERDGLLRPGSILVESSSGNLGVALSMIAASRGYRFVCVTDSRCNLATKRLMEALGAEVHTIVEPGSGHRVPRRPAGPGPRADRVRRPVRVAQPVRQPATPGRRTTAGPARPSPASSRGWTCCSSAPAPPAP